ncbi:hypothetical protein EX30DRAFT_338608 [Ascodesmis nigricans]|uniref:Signal peptidase complex subunit 2 n=1 Tax=Ascodesmis nigricans TaxID=341454 RepID=A0A4S2N455_9PEZI|nr:hypothetical protein EX30DRAFT_338608 [Ascodesmis nigricans]
MDERPKANLNAIAELKNTTDDAIAPYMESLGFKQSHLLTDVRLGLGFVACAIAAATFYYDYTLGFEKTKGYTVYAVVAYFVLNTILTVWIWWIEGNTVYLGKKGDVTIKFESSSKKYTPIYELRIVTTRGKEAPKTAEVQNPYSGWFDQLGFFVPKPFHAFITNSVPLLAKNEPEAVGSVAKSKKAKA